MKKLKIPQSEIELGFSRSSGAGGQNVNKVNSKVTLKWNIVQSEVLPEKAKARFLQRYKNKINQEGQLVLSCQVSRDQKTNQKVVFEKLYQMMESSLREPKKRKKTKPTKSSVEKRLKNKKLRSEIKKMRQKTHRE